MEMNSLPTVTKNSTRKKTVAAGRGFALGWEHR